MSDRSRLLLYLGIIILAFLCVFSIPFFDISPFLTLLICGILVVFGFAIYLSADAGKKINAYILAVRFHELSAKDRKQIFKLACLRMLPIWLCVIVVSVFPLTQWEAWLMVCLPCVVIYTIAARVVFRDYHMLTGEAWRFWVLQIGMFAAVHAVCQSIILAITN